MPVLGRVNVLLANCPVYGLSLLNNDMQELKSAAVAAAGNGSLVHIKTL